MDEGEFNKIADLTLAQVENAVEQLDLDLDLELKPGGVLEIEFGSGSKVIVNRHGVAREIWVAAKSGGYHFRAQAGRWVGTRDGRDLFDVLAEVIGQQAGCSVSLSV